MKAAASASNLAQGELFAVPRVGALPGLKYQMDFLAPAEELALLDVIRALSLRQAEYKQWRANRRTIG